ncbi:MAG: WG repeat-containing protein [Acidobacteriota bacterium]
MAVPAVLVAACSLASSSLAPENQWPLPCQLALEEGVDEIARCASRDPSGEITVDPAVVAARVAAGTIYNPPPGTVYQVDVESTRLFVLDSGKTAPRLRGYDTAFFDEGLVRTERSGKVGFLDENLVEVISPAWDYAFPFKSGLAVVCNGCKTKVIVETTVKVGGLWGYIDTQGQVVVPLIHSKGELPPREQVRRDRSGL